MKISKRKLRRIIREETHRILNEQQDHASDVLMDMVNSSGNLSGGIAIRRNDLIIAARGYPEIRLGVHNKPEITVNAIGADGDTYEDRNSIRTLRDLGGILDERGRHNFFFTADPKLLLVRLVISDNAYISVDELTDAKSVEVVMVEPTIDYSEYNLFRS